MVMEITAMTFSALPLSAFMGCAQTKKRISAPMMALILNYDKLY